MDLHGAHAVVIGGSKGVGAALAQELARRGCRLTLIARPSPQLEDVAADVGAMPLPVDLADYGALEGVIARAEEETGPVDVLVSNAATVSSGPFHELTAEELQRGVMTNFVAHLELCRQALPGMRARGRGAIGIVGTMAAELSMIHLGTYAPAKAGLAKFGVDLQTELKRTGVAVHVFVLGAVPDTQLSQLGVKDPVVDYLDKKTASFGTLTSPTVARRIADRLASNRRTSVVTMPRMAAPLVQFRLLPIRLTDPVLGRTSRAAAARVRAAAEHDRASPSSQCQADDRMTHWS